MNTLSVLEQLFYVAFAFSEKGFASKESEVHNENMPI